jgi:hypothetical protein
MYRILSRKLSSSALKAKFVPELPQKSRSIIAISMARYEGEISQREQYDREIVALLEHSAHALERGHIASVDVVSAAGLPNTWGKEKSKEIEDHFFTTHRNLLEKQTGFYTFSQLIQKLGPEKFSKCMDSVEASSGHGSEWFKNMEKTYESTRVRSGLDHSLLYQRTEYAAILAMSGVYSNIIYMGNLSLGWAYLYKQYENEDLPIFTRAAVEKIFKKSQISTAEAEYKVESILREVENILTNEQFPIKQKSKLINSGTSFFYAYSPRIPMGGAPSKIADSKQFSLTTPKR